MECIKNLTNACCRTGFPLRSKPAVNASVRSMGRTCDCTYNRDALLASEVAVCFYCFYQLPPSEIEKWCDGADSTQTAIICPRCDVDSVVGFNGPVDMDWVHARHARSFG
jgi:hypothetical protein